MEAVKYGRTYHFPFSPGLKNDDRRIEDEYCFDGKTGAVTIKMDGENTTMYRGVGNIHARSLYQMSHPSQHWIRAYHGQIQYLIPDRWRVCGENLYARHSIPYTNLESFFMVFNIWDENNMCLPLSDTLEWCRENGICHVPVVGTVNVKGNDFSAIEHQFDIAVRNGQEGIVFRNIEAFHFDDFQANIVKAVRKNHVQTDVHWTKTWIPNKLREV